MDNVLILADGGVLLLKAISVIHLDFQAVLNDFKTKTPVEFGNEKKIVNYESIIKGFVEKLEIKEEEERKNINTNYKEKVIKILRDLKYMVNADNFPPNKAKNRENKFIEMVYKYIKKLSKLGEPKTRIKNLEDIIVYSEKKIESIEKKYNVVN